jgi:hypothetical protein
MSSSQATSAPGSLPNGMISGSGGDDSNSEWRCARIWPRNTLWIAKNRQGNLAYRGRIAGSAV